VEVILEPEHEGVLGTTGNELGHEARKVLVGQLLGHGAARRGGEESREL
jgi:hypothetical protein